MSKTCHRGDSTLPPCLSCSEISVKQWHIRPSMSFQKHAKGRTLLCQLDFFCSELSVKHQHSQNINAISETCHRWASTLLPCLSCSELSVTQWHINVMSKTDRRWDPSQLPLPFRQGSFWLSFLSHISTVSLSMSCQKHAKETPSKEERWSHQGQMSV